MEILSRQSTRETVYPRPDYTSLYNLLKTENAQKADLESANLSLIESEEDLTSKFAVMYNLASGAQAIFGPSDVKEFAATDDTPEVMLLFPRGFPLPQWLNVVGDKHGVSPDLYQRHLQYKTFALGGRDLCSSPSLPSSNARVVQLTIPSICVRSVGRSPYEPEDLQKARHLESQALGKYFLQMRNKAVVADSVVRKCLLLSKQEHVLEQTISIEVSRSEDAWRAIVWLDSGRDLALGVEGH